MPTKRDEKWCTLPEAWGRGALESSNTMSETTPPVSAGTSWSADDALEHPEESLPTDPARRERNALVAVLGLTSGATDAIGFLALGSAFTSVMTGNMVLFGIALAEQDWESLALVAVAIGSYITGAAIGARVCGQAGGGDPVWPHGVSRGMRVELVLFSVFAVSWWLLGSDPPTDLFLPLLALNASALGIQSSAIQRFGVSGLSTTYMTGTLTTVVIRLVSGRGLGAVRHSLTIIGCLVLGAVLGALAVAWAPVAVPLVQLTPLVAVIGASRLHRHRLGVR